MGSFDEGRVFWLIRSARSHNYLGWAYKEFGWTEKAVVQYEKLIELWKNADQVFDIYEDAKLRLKQLKAVSSS